MNAQDRSLLRALKEMTAEPSPLANLVSRAQTALDELPLGALASRVRKALSPTQAFDAKAWAESIVKVRPGIVGGWDVAIGDYATEHWTRQTEAIWACARLRDALIASLPEHLGSR